MACGTGEPVEHEVDLGVGQAVTVEVHAGEAHYLHFAMSPGEYVHVLVEQHGVDVELFVDGPEGELLYEADTPSGRTGTEEAFLVAAESGRHTLRLVPFGKKAAGRLSVLAVERRPASEEDRLRARARADLARALRRSLADQHEAAVAAYREALPLLEALGEEELWAQSNWHLGEALAAAGRLREAAEQLRRSLEIFERRKDVLGQARAATDLGGVLQSLGDLDGAEHVFQGSLANYREANVPQGIATALHNLGLVNASRADFAASLDLYHQALDAWRRLDRPRAEATTLLSLASVYARIGREAEALGFVQQALARLPPSSTAERQHALVELAWIHLLNGRAETALAGFDEALKLARSRHDLVGEAAILGRRSSALRDLGRLDEAVADSRQSLELARGMGNRRSAGHSLVNLGSLEAKGGDLDAARDDLTEAVDLLTVTGDTNGAVAAHVELARVQRKLGELDIARENLVTAAAEVEEVRSTVPGDLSRSYFLAERYDVFEELASLDLELYRATGNEVHALHALAAAERGRARTLLEGLAATKRSGSGREAALAEIRALEARRVELAHTAGAGAEVDGLEERIRMLALEADRRSGTAAVAGVQPLDAAGMQGLLDGDTLLLVYLLSEPQSVLWTVSHDDVQVHRLPGRRKIEERARDAVKQLRWSRLGTESAQMEITVRDLSRQLLAPAADRIAAFSRLVVLADGALHAVPFAALPVPGGGDASSSTVTRSSTCLPPLCSLGNGSASPTGPPLRDRWPCWRMQCSRLPTHVSQGPRKKPPCRQISAAPSRLSTCAACADCLSAAKRRAPWSLLCPKEGRLRHSVSRPTASESSPERSPITASSTSPPTAWSTRCTLSSQALSSPCTMPRDSSKTVSSAPMRSLPSIFRLSSSCFLRARPASAARSAAREWWA